MSHQDDHTHLRVKRRRAFHFAIALQTLCTCLFSGFALYWAGRGIWIYFSDLSHTLLVGTPLVASGFFGVMAAWMWHMRSLLITAAAKAEDA